MELQNEREETVCRYELDLTSEEREDILRYAENNIPEDEYENLLIEWAVVDLLTKAVDDAKKSS